MKKIFIVILTITMCVSLTGCELLLNKEKKSNDDYIKYLELSNKFVDNLINEQYDSCTEMFASTMKNSLSADKLKEAWETTIKNSGEYIEIEKDEIEQKNGFEVVRLYMVFANQGVITQITFDKNNEISGLWFNYYNSEKNLDQKTLPDGLEELPITIGDGETALSGKLTKPISNKSEFAAILVHGSGSSDMDETIFGNKPFRDIAWGLASQGVDVLRYDKRSFTYPEQFLGENYNKFTVYEETIEDAILAGNLLKEMGYNKVYLIGHSLGGMLAPRIQEESNGLFDGLVIMAGSPRTLTDIIIDQNNASIETLPQEQKLLAEEIVAKEIKKLEELNSMTEQQLSTEQVFGISAYYIKDMNSYNTFESAKTLEVPIFVIQGSKDFQVYADKDYLLWQDALKSNTLAQFKLYEGLTHLFTKAPDVQTKTIQDYTPAQEVALEVIEDIYKFIVNK